MNVFKTIIFFTYSVISLTDIQNRGLHLASSEGKLQTDPLNMDRFIYHLMLNPTSMQRWCSQSWLCRVTFRLGGWSSFSPAFDIDTYVL